MQIILNYKKQNLSHTSQKKSLWVNVLPAINKEYTTEIMKNVNRYCSRLKDSELFGKEVEICGIPEEGSITKSGVPIRNSCISFRLFCWLLSFAFFLRETFFAENEWSLIY